MRSRTRSRWWSAALALLALMLATQAVGLPAERVDADTSTNPTAYVTVQHADETCSFGRLDLVTGGIDITSTPGGATCVFSLAIGPDASIYGVTGDQLLVRVDATTGVGTTVGPLGVTWILPAGGLSFDRSGALWLYHESTNPDCSADFSCLYRVDPTDATTTFVGGGGSETIVGGLAGLCDGRVVTARNTPPQQLAAVDTSTGSLTDLGPLAPTYFVNDLATQADGTLWALASPPTGSDTQVQRIDPAGPTVVNGPLLSGPDAPLAFAIAPLTCPAPEPPPTPPTAPATAPRVVEPSFTG